jgi:outer membrane protein assembly factor BamB
MPSRRRFLSFGAAAAFAGCTTKADDPPKAGRDESPDPSRHIYAANGGLAVNGNLYASGTNGLHAIDPESGEQLWTKDTGDWRYTAPVLARDTLFVGGDKLFAFDPTPSSSPFSEDGPALRFEKSFHGRVGPGPILDDGVLYVVAQTGNETYQLVALE